MELAAFGGLLGWCTIFGWAILLFWWAMVVVAGVWMHEVHGRWFELSRSAFSTTHYAGMGLLKLSILLFNLFPCLALRVDAKASGRTATRKAMADEEVDELRAQLEMYVGKPMGPPSVAPDPVNVPMIRHWVDALDDRDPVYLDEAFARTTRFGGIVAPPAMLQAWSMPRPRIEGIAERGGAPAEMTHDNIIIALNRAGYVGTLATNSELEFVRYLKPGDLLHVTNELESVSNRKTTSLGKGYFVTWVTTYTSDDEVVGRQLFRVFKFDPSTIRFGAES